MFQSLFGSRTQSTPVKNVNVQELHKDIQANADALIIDVRSPGEYQHDGHIAGSRLLPLQSLGQRLDELPKDRKLVLVCRSGNRSHVACEQLIRAGYTDVVNLSGGMMAWKMAGLPAK